MTVVVGAQFFGGGELSVSDWDTIFLAGVRWPGIASVEGKGITRRIDIKRTKGSDGARLKDEGNDPAEFTISLLIYNQPDWVRLQRLLPTVTPRRPGGPRTPISVIYPSLRVLGISTCYIKGVPVFALDKSTQQLTVTLQAIEWIARPKKLRKGSGTKNGQATIEGIGIDQKEVLLTAEELLLRNQQDQENIGLIGDAITAEQQIKENTFGDDERRLENSNDL
jgi:hypothetical protein